jgi:ABC-type phosphate transport system substrate-binding protein
MAVTHLAPSVWALCLILLCGWLTRAKADEVVVAVNAASPAGKSITGNMLSAIFGMRLRTWQDGTPIRVYVLPDNHAVHITFAKHVLHVFPHQLRAAWDRMVYSGTGQAPVEVPTEEDMRARIAGTRDPTLVVLRSPEEMREKLAADSSAVGYLTTKMVDERVKVLPVQ